ncbi:MAG: hypothetical protein LC798_05295 [Chloroflexi bacterium]|nr:hypothetical protein [Chloroflexota bacterium]
MGDKVLNVFASMVTLGMVTVVVTNGGNSANVIRAVGELFSNSLGTAMGRR